MLVEGTCDNGHALVCALHGGRITGAFAHGALRDKCPVCGGPLQKHVESAVLPVNKRSDPDIQIEDPRVKAR